VVVGLGPASPEQASHPGDPPLSRLRRTRPVRWRCKTLCHPVCQRRDETGGVDEGQTKSPSAGVAVPEADYGEGLFLMRGDGHPPRRGPDVVEPDAIGVEKTPLLFHIPMLAPSAAGIQRPVRNRVAIPLTWSAEAGSQWSHVAEQHPRLGNDRRHRRRSPPGASQDRKWGRFRRSSKRGP